MSNDLDKYFAGELSQEEKDKLLKDVVNDPALEEEFISMQNLMGLSDLASREGDNEWGKLKFEDFERHMKRRTRRQLWVNVSKYAAIVVFAFLSAWFLSRQYFYEPLKDAYTEIEVPQGHRALIRLDDGTSVWLNSRSKLRYPNVFAGDKRAVVLDGEGYFTVAKNQKKPFVVKTSRYDVEVLGTKFNVFNYSESPVFETTLLEGAVKVFRADNEESAVHLKPNEQIVMKDGALQKRQLEQQDISLWESAYFIFDNEPFEDIINKLSMYYNVKFVIRNESALQYAYNGNFSSEDSLEDILDAIQHVQKFNFTMSSDKKMIYID